LTSRDLAMDPTKEQHQILYKSRKKCDGDPGMSSTRKVQSHRDRKKTRQARSKSQEHAHHFLIHQGDSSQRIRPGRPNGQFRIILLRLMGTA
jgi:hypothetical protein